MLIFFLGFVFGGILGMAITAIVAASGTRTQTEEAYYKGIECGKIINKT